MTLTEYKIEIKENMKEFIIKLTQEHGYTIENAKQILICEAMDSAYEVGTHRNQNP